MDTIEAARSLLDRQDNLAIWYAEYDGGPEESIRYANPLFSKTFDLSLAEILERKRYHLVNPPLTPAEVIETYKNEDRQAMEHGFFLQRSPIEPGKDILVLKLRFHRGILGLFKIVPADPSAPPFTLQDLDPDFREIVANLAPEQLQ